MKELELKYGCNPNQKPASISVSDGRDLPIEILGGKPGYINLLDAFNSWQLVKELKEATGLPAAASFKHVSPAGAAVGLPLSDTDKAIYFVDQDAELSPIACAYIRARGADRLCSYGDWAALSDTCDAATAAYLKPEVSDGIIAPDFTPEALEILRAKKKGGYNIVKIDPNYVPAVQEHKDVFGITFEQGRNNYKIDESLLTNLVSENKELPDSAKIDMIVALITLKYTQSNSVCYVKDGQAIGVGAGQQSRIHCTRLAGNKADNWYLRQHPKTLGLQFLDTIRRPDRDNAIDVYLSDEYEDVLRDGVGNVCTLCKLLNHQLAVGIGNTFGDCNNALTVGLVDSLDVSIELFKIKGNLGEVDEVGAHAVVGGNGACGGKPTCVTAHDLKNGDHTGIVNSGVKVDLHCGSGNVLCSRGIAGAVVGAEKVVIDGLGNTHDTALIAILEHKLAYLVAGIHGVVAAVVEEITDVILLEYLKNSLIIGIVNIGVLELVTAGTKSGRRGVFQQGKFFGIFGTHIVKNVIKNALDTVSGTVDLGDNIAVKSGTDSTVCAGVNDRAGAAGLTDDAGTF